MFLSTILSALPLLHPALPQQPVQKPCSACTCKQEPVAQTTPSGKKQVIAKAKAQRALRQTIRQTSNTQQTTQGGNKTAAQNALRKTIRQTSGANQRGVWKVAGTPNPTVQPVTWGNPGNIAGFDRAGKKITTQKQQAWSDAPQGNIPGFDRAGDKISGKSANDNRWTGPTGNIPGFDRAGDKISGKKNRQR